MQNLTVFKNDTAFAIPFHLINYDTTDKDITGYKPMFKVWMSKSTDTLLFSGSTTIDVASTGNCRYIVVSTDLIATGIFTAEVELTNTTTGYRQTWEQFTLTIKESP